MSRVESWSQAELTVARAAMSVQRPGEGAWLNAGTFTAYWQQVARAVIEAQRTQQEAAMSGSEIVDGLVISPGDTLVLRVGSMRSLADGERIKTEIQERLPGVTVLVIGGVEQMAVYRPEATDE